MIEGFDKLGMSEEKKDNKNNTEKKKGFKPPQKPDGDFDWTKVIRSVLSWGAVIIAAVIVMQFMNEDKSSGTELDFDEYEKLLNADKIKEATILKDEANIYIFEGKLKEKEFINNKSITKFRVTMVEPIIQGQVKIWKEKNVKFTFVKQSNDWMTLLISFIPWILIIGVWVIFMKRMQGGGPGGQKGIFSFGKSRAKLISES
ncbi:MAG: cell division protein FtsH, partial [Chlorobi bacterium]|nr:cell division protein FtsH [Chlorobiota bacterium]